MCVDCENKMFFFSTPHKNVFIPKKSKKYNIKTNPGSKKEEEFGYILIRT